MSDRPLELRAGLLALGDARFARRSRLLASPGELAVARGSQGGRRTALDVTGARLQPAQNPAEAVGRFPLAVVHHERGLLCTLDLGLWTPVQVADQVNPRPVRDRLEETATALAGALGVPWSAKPGKGSAAHGSAPALSPVDPLLARAHNGAMLACAVVVAAGLAVGLRQQVPALLVISAVAALVLPLLGLSPLRWWVGRTGRDGDWLRVVTRSRAGWVALGAHPLGADTAEEADDTLTLVSGRVGVVALPDAGERLRSTLPDVVRRRRAERPRSLPDELDLARPAEESVFGAVGYAVLQVLAALLVRSSSAAAAACFVLGALVSLVLAVALVRGRSRRSA